MHRMLDFYRPGAVKAEQVDLLELLQHVLNLASQQLMQRRIEVKKELPQSLPAIYVVSGQIQQVFLNLILNSLDAMPNGGELKIGARALEDGVELTFHDSGPGIPEDRRNDIFEPFFSTKEIGKGTGLGLSTVFGIVKQSAGTIWVYSEPGHGTTFKIYFPRCEEAPVIIQPEMATPLRGGSETILLVEDAAPLRKLTRRLLEDPAEAIRIAGEHKGLLPLMITDVVMPGFSGPVLAERLAITRPETKVLYTSGYIDDTAVRNDVLNPDRAFLEKPFTRDDLVRKVRELLDSPIHPFS
jgi:CheY-like chemotaxis protein